MALRSDHYDEAELSLGQAQRYAEEGNLDLATLCLLDAQVHATLACASDVVAD